MHIKYIYIYICICVYIEREKERLVHAIIISILLIILILISIMSNMQIKNVVILCISAFYNISEVCECSWKHQSLNEKLRKMAAKGSAGPGGGAWDKGEGGGVYVYIYRYIVIHANCFISNISYSILAIVADASIGLFRTSCKTLRCERAVHLGLILELHCLTAYVHGCMSVYVFRYTHISVCTIYTHTYT